MKLSSLHTPILCLSLLALAACSGKGKDQGPPKMPTPTVGVVKAQLQSTTLNKDLVGRLSAFRSADVRARVSGLLLKRTYKEGTDVKQGQLLFQIDPATYKAALDSSLANLTSAKATYTNAHVVAERDRSLIPQGYISHAQLDSDEATERTAAAAIQQAQAAVASARINLDYTKVVSPIDGRAGQQQLTEGAIVGNGTSRHRLRLDPADHRPAARPALRELHHERDRYVDDATGAECGHRPSRRSEQDHSADHPARRHQIWPARHAGLLRHLGEPPPAPSICAPWCPIRNTSCCQACTSLLAPTLASRTTYS
jgi:multidrug efflux pump subunit AcrA (membrane-fusion protein)